MINKGACQVNLITGYNVIIELTTYGGAQKSCVELGVTNVETMCFSVHSALYGDEQPIT